MFKVVIESIGCYILFVRSLYVNVKEGGRRKGSRDEVRRRRGLGVRVQFINGNLVIFLIV